MARPAALATIVFVASAPMVLVTASAAVAARTTSPGPVHALFTREIALSQTECRLAATLASTRLARHQRCTATVTGELSATPVVDQGSTASRAEPIPSCPTTWSIDSMRVTVESLFWGLVWSASANATGYGDACGRVMWTSVTCDQHAVGYTVSIDWCGAFPELWTWNPYTTTNIGTNITVSAVAEGIPIVFTHGARNGFDPYAGTPYGAFVW